MSYTYERPDLRALTELEQLFQNLGAEVLATWRRRSLKAEAELQDVPGQGWRLAGPELSESRQRAVELETENQALRERIEAAKERVRSLAARLAFLDRRGGPRVTTAKNAVRVSSAVRNTRSAPSCRPSTPARWPPISTPR